MAQVKVTDQFTGEFTICEVQDLAATMTVYGMTAEEIQTWKDAQAALLDNDWYALPVMSEILQADIEIVEEQPEVPENASDTQRRVLADAGKLETEWQQYDGVLMLAVTGAGPVPSRYRIYASRSDHTGRVSHSASVSYVLGGQSRKITLRQLRAAVREQARNA